MKGEDTLLNYGIAIEGFGNLVIENLIEEMTQSNGIGLIDGFYNTICWNRVYTYLGIYLKNSNANDIVGNIFMDEDSAYGLRSSESWDNNIAGNNFWSSILCLDIDDAERYFFSLNLFVGDIQIGDISDSLWSNLFMEGNCWGDYTGVDTDNDGIGNTNVPHNNVDLFPLMEIETIDVSYLINVFENRINMPQKSKEKYLKILNRAQKFIDAGKTTNAIRALESFQKLVSEELLVPEMSPSSDQGTYLNWICDFIIYDLEYP